MVLKLLRMYIQKKQLMREYKLFKVLNLNGYSKNWFNVLFCSIMVQKKS